jgi:hypothetical protein
VFGGKQMYHTGFPSLAVAAGAAAPNPGFPAIIWSTTAGAFLGWDGNSWEVLASGGGGGGSGNSVRVEVDFGTHDTYVEVVVAAPWATGASRITASPAPPSTADHDPEDALIEGLVAGVVSVTNGVGFTLGVSAPNGTWGRYNFDCLGV